MTQLIGVLVVLVYTAIITLILLKVTEALVGNRVSSDEEVGGLDHGLTMNAVTTYR